MKLEAPANANYAATVVELKTIVPLEGCDRVNGAKFAGYQAILSKDHQPGELGVYFSAETQLSEEFASFNNQYRDENLNKDKTKKGYLETNRRVKALKFRGHESNALWFPIESLSYIKGYKELVAGDTFDKIGNHDICKKYILPVKQSQNLTQKNKVKSFSRVDRAHFPLHFDTDQWLRVEGSISGDREISITQKLHGTSLRVANTLVARQLNWKEKLAKRFGIPVKETEYDLVYGSRRVTKDIRNPNQQHFYAADEAGYDLWTQVGKEIGDVLPQGYMLFAEIIGWTKDGGAIQAGYTYRIPQGQHETYVYRVAQINPQGRLVDLSWDQVKEFCNDAGLKHVPELARQLKHQFDPELWLDKRYRDEGYWQAVDLEPGTKKRPVVDEGCVIRIEGLVPYCGKLKSPIFYRYETEQLDTGNADIESAESEEA